MADRGTLPYISQALTNDNSVIAISGKWMSWMKYRAKARSSYCVSASLVGVPNILFSRSDRLDEPQPPTFHCAILQSGTGAQFASAHLHHIALQSRHHQRHFRRVDIGT